LHEYISENNLGHRIKKKRLQLTMSTTELSKRLEISEALLYTYESNIVYPLGKTLRALSKILKVPIKYLDDSDYCKFIRSDYGAIIKKWRVAHSLNLRQASKVVGISSSAIGSWESGVYIPDKNSFEKLRQFLNL
jgi:transcriptional regulator with XRE-family HTH domain